MTDLSDVGVDEDVNCPRVGEFLVDGPFAEDVHVKGERDVFDHDKVVGQGQAGQDGVGGRDLLVHPRQDDNVERVGDEAEQAHHQGDVAVHQKVMLPESLQPFAAVEFGRWRRRQDGRRWGGH